MSVARSVATCTPDQLGAADGWPMCPAGTFKRVPDHYSRARSLLSPPPAVGALLDVLERFLFGRDDLYGARGVPTNARQLAELMGKGVERAVWALGWAVDRGVVVKLRDRPRGPRSYRYHLAHPSAWSYPMGKRAPADRHGDLTRRRIDGCGVEVCAFPTWSAPLDLPARLHVVPPAGGASYPQAPAAHDRPGPITSRGRSSPSEIPDHDPLKGPSGWDRCWVDVVRGAKVARIGLVAACTLAARELVGESWIADTVGAHGSISVALARAVKQRLDAAAEHGGRQPFDVVAVRGALLRAVALAGVLEEDRQLEEQERADREAAAVEAERREVVAGLRGAVERGAALGVDVDRLAVAVEQLARLDAGDVGELPIARVVLEELADALDAVDDAGEALEEPAHQETPAPAPVPEALAGELAGLVAEAEGLEAAAEALAAEVRPAAGRHGRAVRGGRVMALGAARDRVFRLVSVHVPALAVGSGRAVDVVEALREALEELRRAIVDLSPPIAAVSTALEPVFDAQSVSEHDCGASEQTGGSVVEENGALTDVSADRDHALVAGLPHNRGLGGAGGGGLGGEAAPERMGGEPGGVEARPGGGALDDPGDGPPVEALGGDAVVSVDRPEDRPVDDPGRGKPRGDGVDGAELGAARPRDPDHPPAGLLVRLGAPQGDGEALGAGAEVAHLEAHQLRPAKRARKPNEKHGAIAQPGPGAQRARGDHLPELLDHRGFGGALGSGPDAPASTSEHRAHLRVVRGGKVPGGAVRDGDGG